jgi:predicted phage terminase large subunit-like protein
MTLSALSATRLPTPEQIVTERARRSLAEFIRQAWPVVEPGSHYVPGWHLAAICEHLEAVTRGEIRRLLINVPPRSGKSLTVSVFWPGWVWATRPETRWLYASYAQSLSTRDSVRCRRLIESPWYRERWGDVFELTSDQNVKVRFENDRSGVRIATSVGGSATGEGGDVIVCDDAHKIEEAYSDTIREGVLDWWDHTMSTRLNDPRSGAMVHIGQRVHQRDLAGHVLSQGGWDHLCLPAEFEPTHPFVWPDDPRREPGELLCPERVGVQEIETLKNSLGTYAAAGQLQQRPAPAGGGIFERRWWRYYDPKEPLPEPEQVLQSWDLAFSGTSTSDYVVGQVWGQHGADKYLLRQVRERMEFTATIAAVREMTAWVDEHYHCQRGHAILVERAANGAALLDVLGSEIPGLIPVVPRGDKLARARAITPQVEAGNIHLPGASSAEGDRYDRDDTPAWVQSLIEEAAAFPSGAFDDGIDAMVQAISRLSESLPRIRVLG